MAEYIPNQSNSLSRVMRDEYGRLLSGVSGMVTSSVAEPIAGLNALVHGNPELVQQTRDRLTFGNPANLIPNNLSLPKWAQTGIGYFNESADRLGEISPFAGAALKTAPAFVGAFAAPQSRAAFANVTDDIGRAMANPSFTIGANSQRGHIKMFMPDTSNEIASINAQRGAIGVMNPDEYLDLYHGSYEQIPEIKDSGVFGGIFASGKKSAAASHGKNIHKMSIKKDKIMRQYDYEDILDSDIKNAAPWLDDADIDRARDLIVYDSMPTDSDVLMLGADGFGEASWEAQRIRGLIAKNKGFSAAEMPDEHGTSYLVLPGNKINYDP